MEGGHRGQRGPMRGEGRKVDFAWWAHSRVYGCHMIQLHSWNLYNVINQGYSKTIQLKKKKTVSLWIYLSGIKGESGFSGKQNKEFVTIGPTPKGWLTGGIFLNGKKMIKEEILEHQERRKNDRIK